MKVIKIIFAVLAALWALALIPKLIAEISHTDAPLLISRLLGSITGILIMTAISIVLFRSAFKK
jgi:hypothetical protein